jgi:5-methylcytosine-specific restriction endonuclease McrA
VKVSHGEPGVAAIDRDALAIRRAAYLLLDGDEEAARAALGDVAWDESPIEYPAQLPCGPVLPESMRVKRDTPTALSFRVFRDDNWRCCFCGRLLIAWQAMKYVALLVGPEPTGVFPWKSTAYPMWDEERIEFRQRGTCPTHQAIERLLPVIAHITPLSRPGGDNRRENLRAACTPCNGRQGERTLAEMQIDLLPSGSPGWDGLKPLIGPLADALKKRQPAA